MFSQWTKIISTEQNQFAFNQHVIIVFGDYLEGKKAMNP